MILNENQIEEGSKPIDDEVLGDKKISFAIVLQFCMLITNYTFKQVFNISNSSTRYMISAIFMILVGLYFISIINIVAKRRIRVFLNAYVVACIILLANILFFWGNLQYLLEVSFYLLLMCLPVFLYYGAIVNKHILLKMLIKSSYYQIILGIIFFISTDFTVYQYDMVFSYLLLVPVTFLFYKLYEKFNIVDLFLSLIGISMILIIGSRGPMLFLVLFWFMLGLRYLLIGRNAFKKLSIISLFMLMVIIILQTFLLMASDLSIFLGDIGFSSRTLEIFLNFTGDFSAGRIDIYTSTIEWIKEKPFIGYGLAGDRVLLEGTYPHNLFLEILVQFGIIIGSFVIIFLLIKWTKALFFNANDAERDLALIFFVIGVLQLMVSGSYLTSINFWLFMGICMFPSTNGLRVENLNTPIVIKERLS